jgi:hypothetical protein
MLFQNLAIISAFAAFATAQDVDQSDVPQQCTAVCAEVVSISRRCDNTTSMYIFAAPNLPLPNIRLCRQRHSRTRMHLPLPQCRHPNPHVRSLRRTIRQ